MSKNAAGLEIFTGFKIPYPEYLVITPQTVQEFTIRSLTVQEEETLKASMLTPNKLPDHLNSVIYSCLVKKPETIKTFDDFLNNITIKDRDALMYGLYHVTYKDIHNYDVTCSACNNINPVKINFLKSMKANLWPNKDSVLKKEVKVPLEIAKSISAIVVQPKLIDESVMIKENAFATDAVRDMYMDLLTIKRFEIDVPESKAPDTIEDRENILLGYKQLPSTDRKLIDKAYAENFGIYNLNVQSIVRCQKCGSEEEVIIDLVRQFFRSIYL